MTAAIAATCHIVASRRPPSKPASPPGHKRYLEFGPVAQGASVRFFDTSWCPVFGAVSSRAFPAIAALRRLVADVSAMAVVAVALCGCSAAPIIDMHAAEYRETEATAGDAQLLQIILTLSTASCFTGLLYGRQ